MFRALNYVVWSRFATKADVCACRIKFTARTGARRHRRCSELMFQECICTVWILGPDMLFADPIDGRSAPNTCGEKMIGYDGGGTEYTFVKRYGLSAGLVNR